jgi:hypothetical protein
MITARRPVRRPILRTDLATLESLLTDHAAVLGRDLDGYRNHAYRVTNLCLAFAAAGPQEIEQIEIAAAFHDLGIWTGRTFDYLAPSVELAAAHLHSSGKSSWVREITGMILAHHKILPAREQPSSLVEPFRRADWVDVSRGLITFGVARPFLAEIFSVWPSAGFHKRLVELALARARSHPWNPLPMLRL